MAEKQQIRRRRSSAAPGQYYGYSVVQGARLLHRLLIASIGDVVSLEALDDISVDGDSGLVLEQDKSGLSHNPIADSSPELWKTFSNWLDGLRDGRIPLGAKYVLYVAQPHTGAIAERIHQCKTSSDGIVLARTLREELWGQPPAYAPRAGISNSLRKHLDLVLEAADEVLADIFANFELVRGSGAPYDDTLQLLGTKALGSDAIEPTHNHLIGWCQKKVAKSIESGKVPAVSVREFQVQLWACARKFDRAEKELVPSPRTVSDEEVREQLKSGFYIQQMRLVELSDEHMLDAVTDCLRASADRTSWGVKGYVLEDSFGEYESELIKVWRRQRDALNIEYQGREEEVVGRAVYFKCVAERIPLQRMPVPEYFTPGTFHFLSDSGAVGWHPRFRDLLILKRSGG